MTPAFAVWITGLPGSGKSTLTAALVRELRRAGLQPAVLESDALRRVLTPHPRYDEEEREMFYGAMAYIGCLLVEHGVPVLFDATANRRAFRDRARREIARFMEVHVECPVAVCEGRDPKGIYRRGREGLISDVPGLQAPYETPERPELVVRGDDEAPADAARRIVSRLRESGYV